MPTISESPCLCQAPLSIVGMKNKEGTHNYDLADITALRNLAHWIQDSTSMKRLPVHSCDSTVDSLLSFVQSFNFTIVRPYCRMMLLCILLNCSLLICIGGFPLPPVMMTVASR